MKRYDLAEMLANMGMGSLAALESKPRVVIRTEPAPTVQRPPPDPESTVFWCMSHQRYCTLGRWKHKIGRRPGHVQRGGQPY